MDKQKALIAIQRYCAKAERCHWETRQKLREWTVPHYLIDEIMVLLIENNFLNEQRYSNAFVHDKFHLQAWGRIKIVQQLKLKHISQFCIDEALARINEEQYEQTAWQLAQKKSKQLIADTYPAVKKQKIVNYLLQRGFEAKIASQTANKIVNK